MILSIVALLLLILLLLPIYFAVNCNVDVDNKYVVVLVGVFGIVVFDVVVSLDGVNINYQGTINGSFAIIDVKIVNVFDVLAAVNISRINCDIYYGVSCMNGAHNAVTMGLVAAATTAVNKVTTTSVLTRLHVGEKNMLFVSIKGNITILSLILSIIFGGIHGKLHN